MKRDYGAGAGRLGGLMSLAVTATLATAALWVVIGRSLPQSAITTPLVSSAASDAPIVSDSPIPLPPDLASGVFWTPEGEVEDVSGSAYLALPADEVALSASRSMVVAARSSGTGTTIVVRDFPSGSILRSLATGLVRVHATLASDLIYFDGMRQDANGGLSDGGVLRITAQGSDDPTVILAPTRGASGDTGSERGPVLVSPTGATIACVFGGGSGPSTDIVSTSDGSHRHLDGLAVVALWDEVALAAADPASPILLIRLEDGSTVTDATQGSDQVEFLAALAANGFGVVAYHELAPGNSYNIIRVSLDGQRQTLLTQGAAQAPWFLQPRLSSNDQLLLARDPDLGYAVSGGMRELAVLDARTGLFSDGFAAGSKE